MLYNKYSAESTPSRSIRASAYDRGIRETDDYRDWLVRAHYDASNAYDKAVMTLAGGGLGLSITFVHEIAPSPTHVNRLVSAWVFLLISLASVFLSMLTTRGTLVKRIETLDAEREWGISWLGVLTTSLGLIAAITLLLGVVFMFLFVHANL